MRMETQWLDGVAHILIPSRPPRPITKGGKPVSKLAAGWTLGPAFKVNPTLIVLTLKQNDVYRSAWFLDEQFATLLNLEGMGRALDAYVAVPGLVQLKVGMRRFVEQISMPSAEAGALRQLRMEAPGVFEQILQVVSPVEGIQVLDMASVDKDDAVRRLFESGSPLRRISVGKATGLPSLADPSNPTTGTELNAPLEDATRITVCRIDQPLNYRITLADDAGCVVYMPSVQLAVHDGPDHAAAAASFRKTMSDLIGKCLIMPAAERAKLLEPVVVPA